MKRLGCIISFLLFISINLEAQVGIGTTSPDASAILDLSSTTSGFLPPRLTRTQMYAISNPTEGLLVYCSDCNPKGIYFANEYQNWISVFTNRVSGTVGPNDVVSPTGRIWMDRNLGAISLPDSSKDPNGAGSFYQWGRLADGHENQSSSTYHGPVSSSAVNPSDPWYGDFITVTNGQQYDWLQVSDSTLWDGVNAVNNPCPAGYRLPTDQEWINEIATWSSRDEAGAFNSALRLPSPGLRSFADGSMYYPATVYWTSTWDPYTPGYTKILHISLPNFTGVYGTNNRAYGYCVRCIKD